MATATGIVTSDGVIDDERSEAAASPTEGGSWRPWRCLTTKPLREMLATSAAQVEVQERTCLNVIMARKASDEPVGASEDEGEEQSGATCRRR